MTPEAALGPATPAKKIPNATGIVTRTASQVIPLTVVPMISADAPGHREPEVLRDDLVRADDSLERGRRSGSRNPPNAANKQAICRLPKPS